MTLNWLYMIDKQSVLSGRWKCCKETIGITVETYAKMIQTLKKKKIKFVLTRGKRHIASIDCCNFSTHEFCQDPSGRWFDHKSNSSGLVSICFLVLCYSFFFSRLVSYQKFFLIKKKYEACLDIWQGRAVSLRGPFQPATHDIPVFRGGKKEVPKESWDRNALYNKIKEGD